MRTLQNSGGTIRKGNRSLCFQPWIYLHVLPRWQWYNPEPKIPARCSRRLDALKVSEQPIIKNICIKSCRNNINARGNTTKMLRRSRCWSLSLYVHIFSSFLLRLVCVISSFYFVSVSQVSYTGLTSGVASGGQTGQLPPPRDHDNVVSDNRYYFWMLLLLVWPVAGVLAQNE